MKSIYYCIHMHKTNSEELVYISSDPVHILVPHDYSITINYTRMHMCLSANQAKKKAQLKTSEINTKSIRSMSVEKREYYLPFRLRGSVVAAHKWQLLPTRTDALLHTKNLMKTQLLLKHRSSCVPLIRSTHEKIQRFNRCNGSRRGRRKECTTYRRR